MRKACTTFAEAATWRDHSSDNTFWIFGTARLGSAQLQFGTIHAVTAEPIESAKDYAIMRLQLDSAGKQNYFLYFVPCQYTAAIKRMLAGGRW